VPACPAWSVRDLIGHLVGTAEDVLAGRATRFPLSDDLTSAEVRRWDPAPLARVLEQWDELAPAYEQLAGERALMPALFDIVSHAQDLRGALDRPGDRGSEAVVALTEFMLKAWRPPVPFLVRFDDETAVEVGAWREGGLELTTTRWEFLRWNSGRRSLRQVAAMQWSTRPDTALLAGVGIFTLAAAVAPLGPVRGRARQSCCSSVRTWRCRGQRARFDDPVPRPGEELTEIRAEQEEAMDARSWRVPGPPSCGSRRRSTARAPPPSRQLLQILGPVTRTHLAGPGGGTGRRGGGVE